MAPLQRIAIIGPSATGKSTLARRLGSLLGIPVYHLDALYWRPAWVATPDDEWDATLQRIVAADRWIVDGNFTASIQRRLEAADTVIFLDLPRRVSLLAVVRRRIQQLWRLPPGVAEGCRPMFNLRLFRWIWTFPKDHRQAFLQMLERQPPEKQVLILRSRRDVRRLVASVEAGLASGALGRSGDAAVDESRGERVRLPGPSQ
jgi:adenylate kinase family enzyme